MMNQTNKLQTEKRQRFANGIVPVTETDVVGGIPVGYELDDYESNYVTRAKSLVGAPKTQLKSLKDVAAETIDVHWIGGAGDKTRFLGVGPTGIMARALSQFSEKCSSNRYWGYEDVDTIVAHIIASHRGTSGQTKIVLVGHSWGGDAAVEVTNRLKGFGIVVEKLITLDPVSHFRFLPPKNQKEWINVYQRQSVLDYFTAVPLLGPLLAAFCGWIGTATGRVTKADFIATLGGQWGYEYGADQNIESDAGHESASTMLWQLKSRRSDILPSST